MIILLIKIEHKKFCNSCRNSDNDFDDNEKGKISNIFENESLVSNSQTSENIENLSNNQFPVVECGICYEKISSTGKTLGLLGKMKYNIIIYLL